MPIFQEENDLGNRPASPPPPESSPLSESPDSIRTDLCEGPVLEDSESCSGGSGREESASNKEYMLRGTTDVTWKLTDAHDDGQHFRLPLHSGEIIQRLKRGEEPTWLPKRDLLGSLAQDIDFKNRKTTTAPTEPPMLLPSPEISGQETKSTETVDLSQAGLEIERPRSALHSGDFTQSSIQNQRTDNEHGPFHTQKSPWISTTPPRAFFPFENESNFFSADGTYGIAGLRPRAPSLSSSLSSSFVLKPPTTPLVQSESNDDFESYSNVEPVDIALESPKQRRHTLQASFSNHSTPSIPTGSFSNRPLPHLRRDNTYPYQAHQPRRSLNSASISHPASSPQTPTFLRSRRPSYSESSPLHASMVGSYEESILRGRMSTTPSKPLDFVAQIGVLGLGKCKSSLRCPPHVTVPFPAVFYSYETTSHGRAAKSEDGPSPYVGQIDLENNLPSQESARESKKRKPNAVSRRTHPEEADLLDGLTTSQLADKDIRRAEKQKRRSSSPKAPPGGSYRLPETGQLQIIIKNPNKTAVKLFLIPYDLSGMEPGTKTFIRQRSYSAGAAIDSSISTASQSASPNPRDRPTLRYLVHLHICSPSRGRFYLYKSIRLVFANRVPDGKEKLRVEISTPSPRFSIYKPSRETPLGFGTGQPGGNNLKADQAYRRRSSGYALGTRGQAFDGMSGITQALERGFGDSHAPAMGRGSNPTPVQPIPFSFARRPLRTGDDVGQDRPPSIQSPGSSRSSQPATMLDLDTSMSWQSTSSGSSGYDKLAKGDIGYGGNIFAASGVGEGVLSKKLKDLGVGSLGDQNRID